MDRSHTFVGGMAGHALRVAYKEMRSCGIGCSRCIMLHTRHHRRRLHTCRGRRGRVTSVGSFVRHFHCGPAGTMRIRDHVGRLRGVIPVRISRISAGRVRLGFPPYLHDNSCPIVYSRIEGSCNSRAIFSRIALAVGHNRGITFMNGGNRNGSALIGYVVNRVPFANGLGVNRGIRVNCFTRGRTRLLSRGLAVFRAVSGITANRVHLGIGSLLNTFVFNNRASRGCIGILDKKRHDHLTVVGLLLRPIGLLVLSRPAGRLSVRSGSILGRTVGTFSNATVVIDRSHRFLSKLMSGMCRFTNNGMHRRLNNVCSCLHTRGTRDVDRTLTGRMKDRGVSSTNSPSSSSSSTRSSRTSSKGLDCTRRGRRRGGVHGTRGTIGRYRAGVRGLRAHGTRVSTLLVGPRGTAGVRLIARCARLVGDLSRRGRG